MSGERAVLVAMWLIGASTMIYPSYLVGLDAGRSEVRRERTRELQEQITASCTKAWVAACDGGTP